MSKIFTKKRALIAGGVALIAAIGITGAVGATAASDNDEPITGAALTEASRVALEHLGEGRVTDSEVGDEDSYYEVEVTLDDGTEVDVQLDEDFNVVGSEVEDPNEADDNDNDD